MTGTTRSRGSGTRSSLQKECTRTHHKMSAKHLGIDLTRFGGRRDARNLETRAPMAALPPDLETWRLRDDNDAAACNG